MYVAFRVTIALFGVLAGCSCRAQTLAIFADPGKACGLLAEEGFAGAVWEPTSFGYACSSAIAGIEYTVSGDHPGRVKRLKLVLQSGAQPADPAALRAEFGRIAAVLLRRIGLKPPPALRRAIRTTRQFRQTLPGANLTFDPGRPPFLSQALVVRDGATRVVTIPRSP